MKSAELKDRLEGGGACTNAKIKILSTFYLTQHGLNPRYPLTVMNPVNMRIKYAIARIRVTI
ncbi:MAG: hypothetical protein ACYTXY_40310, partial [Nostoc sp.]